jgi:hypothetical protein
VTSLGAIVRGRSTRAASPASNLIWRDASVLRPGRKRRTLGSSPVTFGRTNTAPSGLSGRGGDGEVPITFCRRIEAVHQLTARCLGPEAPDFIGASDQQQVEALTMRGAHCVPARGGARAESNRRRGKRHHRRSAGSRRPARCVRCSRAPQLKFRVLAGRSKRARRTHPVQRRRSESRASASRPSGSSSRSSSWCCSRRPPRT